MQDGPTPMEEYAKAVAAERAAWEAIRGRLPGSLEFDQALWKHWRACVEEADGAAVRAKTPTAASAGRSSGPRYLRDTWPQAVQLPAIFGRRRPEARKA